MAEVGRLESCKAEVMRRLIKDKWSDVEAVCAASHLVTPAIPAMYDAAISTDRVPNGGQVMLAADWVCDQVCIPIHYSVTLHEGV